MGAFRGRSLDFFGEVFGVVEVCCCPAVVGLLFCASPSRSLIPAALPFLSHGADGGHVVWSPVDMLVSGMPSFLGGGMSGSSV